jgi:hypothetical protein
MLYFIPDWDDRVDPGYDFEHDRHTAGRDPYRDDRYAHEIYSDAPPYDGILLSRAVIDAEPRKLAAIQLAGSVHRYLRLPERHTVLGDCGAFSYWQEQEPPYKTEDVLGYYQSLGFNYGVSVDHLIFAELDAERQRRWDITQENAAEFIRLHGQLGHTFVPIGVAQGWDPQSYRRAAAELMKMGYEYIAVGGLVRSQNAEIIRVLAAVQEVLRPGTQVHLFGVSRPEQAQTFAALGVTSFDSASRLRRAWMDGRRNYFLGNAAYTAIRVPEARKLAAKEGLDEASTLRQEQELLQTLRAFDRGKARLDEALERTFAYAALSGKLTDRVRRDYRQTLEEQPWKRCDCRICHSIGVEVIIFRGNNRNRRRGFHNTWQLYQQLRESATMAAPSILMTARMALDLEG